MVAFAIGGLLGDTLLHLIPGSFLGGEDEGEGSAGHSHGVEFVIKNDRKNLLIGGMIMVGFVVFVAMDKALRVAGMRVGTTAGNLGGHGHSYSTTAHGHSQGSGTGTGADGTIKSSGELRKRKGGDGATNGAEQEDEEEEEKQQVQEVKMSSYLNIIADVRNEPLSPLHPPPLPSQPENPSSYFCAAVRPPTCLAHLLGAQVVPTNSLTHLLT